MTDTARSTRILSIDDDTDIRNLIEMSVVSAGFEFDSAPDGPSGLSRAFANPPTLILLDVMMPGMDGYDVCLRLQADPALSGVPVVFLTALGAEQDKAKAFAAGAVDYVVKPFKPSALVDVIRMHVETARRWQGLTRAASEWAERLDPSDFARFRDQLLESMSADEGARGLIGSMRPEDMYAKGQEAGIGQPEMGQLVADFLHLPRVTAFDAKEIDLGALPAPFCRKNLVVPVCTGGKRGLVVANPFDWELLDTIRRFAGSSEEIHVSVAEPRVITSLLSGSQDTADAGEAEEPEQVHAFAEAPGSADLRRVGGDVDIDESDAGPVTYIANNMVVAAVQQHASDIHIEPKDYGTVVRFRIDGDLRDYVTLKRSTAAMMISRLKALAGLDISERRKPQDGSLEADIGGHRCKLRLATTSTPEGESLIIRLLEVTAEAIPLTGLGLAPEQAERLKAHAQRNNGLILIVGMTGSGKTTTIYSLVSTVDGRARSVLTIEDPIEYRIPFANQQQVNDKAGVTFESLLRSVVRQDPDVLVLGEIRDPYSAKMAMDFASTGHLTVTTLHTTNATTAVFRLERLGVTRDVMAEALLCIVAQRLVKRLCPKCRAIDPITDQERAWLAPFTDDIPETVAHPVGCIACAGTGYAGREAVVELIDFDAEIEAMVRAGAPVSEIRRFQRKRGDYLMYDHAIRKIRDHVFAPSDVYERILVEELAAMQGDSALETRAQSTASGEPAPLDDAALDLRVPSAGIPRTRETAADTRRDKPAQTPHILLAEDDDDSRAYVERMLVRGGYDVSSAGDGASALVQLGFGPFDLVIADLEMPTLDGFSLLEIVSQRDLHVPVIMLTGSDNPSDEAQGLSLGAADFIHKPVRQDVLLARIERVLESSRLVPV